MDNPHAESPAAASSAAGMRLRDSWAYIAVLVVAVIAVYGQTLSFDFVTYDDYELVVENEGFLSAWPNALTAFTTHAFTSHRAASGYYRPLLLISYIADYKVWGLNPMGFHATNLLLHLAAVLVVFALCRRLSGEDLPSLAGALLFALHPVQSEAVGWVAGRNDVLLGLFVAAMALAYVRYRQSEAPKIRDLALALLFFACALFTKESAAFYLLLLPLIDLACTGGTLPGLLRWNSVRSFLPFTGVLGLYLAARTAAIGEIVGAEKLYGATPFWQRVTGFPELVTEHLRLMLVPAGLSVAHPVDALFWNAMPWNIVSWAVVAAALALAVWSWRRDRVVALGLSWIGVGLLPVMNIIPLAVPILEHRLYVPLAGAAVAVAALLVRLRRAPLFRTAAPVAAGILVTAAGFATLFRLPVWADSETLWLDTIAKVPGYNRSYLNLAGTYFEARRYDLAAERLEEYLKLRPDDPFALSRLRSTYVLLGLPKRALEVCRRSLERDPRNPARVYELALMFEQLRMTDSAITVCRDALRVGAESHELQSMLGRMLIERGDTAEALPHLGRAVELNPAAADARLRLGMVLWKRGDAAGALRTLEAGLDGRPPNELVDGLARIYLATGQKEKAQALLDRYAFR